MKIPKFIPNSISSKLGDGLLQLGKHSPVILFGAGVLGFGATVYLASKATLKLDEVLKDTDEKIEKSKELLEDVKSGRRKTEKGYSDDDLQRDVVILRVRTAVSVMKLYGPAIIVGLASVGALTGSHIVLTRRYLGVAAAYAALDKAMTEYRSRVVEDVGKEKDDEYRYGLVDKQIAVDTETGTDIQTIKVPGNKNVSMYARFFDESSSMYKREDSYNQVTVKVQQEWANALLQAQGHLFLNEVYDMLGLPRSREGSVVGWLKNSKVGDGFVDFGVFTNGIWDGKRFVNGDERSILLDFNVDGIIYNLI